MEHKTMSILIGTTTGLIVGASLDYASPLPGVGPLWTVVGLCVGVLVPIFEE